VSLIDKLFKVFDFFNINKNEIHLFLKKFDLSHQDIINKDIKNIDEVIEFVSLELHVNKNWFYDNNNELIQITNGFYKRVEYFLTQLKNKTFSKIYIITNRIPNKNFDEEHDNNEPNHIVLVLEYTKFFNSKILHSFEIFQDSSCRYGYWRCRLELKKFLLGLKSKKLINNTIGIISDDIINKIYLFSKGELKFEKILDKMNIWYPEDYIEFKNQNINAKEEDEFKKILDDINNDTNKQRREKGILLEEQFKNYLIEFYGYNEEEFIIEAQIDNRYRVDLSIKIEDQEYIFEVKTQRNKLSPILSKLNNIILVTPYEYDEWCIYKEDIKYITFPNIEKQKILIDKIIKIIFKDGKRDNKTVKEEIVNLFLNKELPSLNDCEIQIVRRIKNLIKLDKNLIIFLFEKLLEYKIMDNYLDFNIVEFIEQIIGKSYISKKEQIFDTELKKLWQTVASNNDLENVNSFVYFIKKVEKYNINTMINDLQSYIQQQDKGFLIFPDSVLYGVDFYEFRKSLIDSKYIKVIFEFETSILHNDIKYTLIYLEYNQNKILFKNIKKIDELFLEIDYIKHDQENKDVIDIEHINAKRLDCFYNKQEFIYLEQIFKAKDDTHTLENIVGDTNIKFGPNIKESKDGEQKLILANNIQNRAISNLSKVSYKDYRKYENYYLKENDILVKSYGLNPGFVQISKEYENCITNSNMINMVISDKNLSNHIYNFFDSIIGRIFLYRVIRHNIKIPKINLFDFKDILVPNDLSVFEQEINDDFKSNFDKSIDEFMVSLMRTELSVAYISNDKLITQNSYETKVIELDEESYFIFDGFYFKKLNIDIFKAKIKIKDIMKINLEKEDFQRDIEFNHKQNIKDYLDKDSNYKYFSDIIIGIDKRLQENSLVVLDNSKIYIAKDIFKDLLVIDGRHRLNAIKDSNIDKNQEISVEFILANQEGFVAIFYILNSKVKTFLPIDFLNTIESKGFEELNNIEANIPKRWKKFIEQLELEINKIDNDKLIKYKIDYKIKLFFDNYPNISQNNKKIFLQISTYLDNLQISENKIFKKIKKIFFLIFYYIPQEFIKDDIVKNLVNLLYFITSVNSTQVTKEFKGFIEWVDINHLWKTIEQSENLEVLYDTYQKIYIPKSRKIYLSMPYHIHEDLIYYALLDAIRKIEKSLNIKLHLIRTDKRQLGIHSQIEQKIWKEIKECDLFIADITGNNPNVFAEIGYKMALDNVSGLVNPQIIFIKNTKGYYEKVFYEEKLNKSDVDEITLNEHIKKNQLIEVAFNYAHIQQIEFYSSDYLVEQIKKILIEYYKFYKPVKVGK